MGFLNDGCKQQLSTTGDVCVRKIWTTLVGVKEEGLKGGSDSKSIFSDLQLAVPYTAYFQRHLNLRQGFNVPIL